MTRLNLPKLIGSAATVACLLSITGQQAQAGQLHNGWNYAIDSFLDGTEGRTIGTESVFEFYGMAMTETEDSVIFALNSNLVISGKNSGSATNGSISWGDLILNFSGSDTFDTATDLYGIRFAQNNDSGVAELGLYENITTKSVASSNSGHGTLNSYNNYVTSSNTKHKENGSWVGGEGEPSLADLDAEAKLAGSDTSYFDLTKSPHNEIASGNKIADITLINDFSGLGLDFEHFNTLGTQTFGFSVDKSFLPSGEFIAHLFAECNNDGMALVGNIEEAMAAAAEVPEPTAMAGLAIFGLGFLTRRRRKDCSAE